MAAAHATMRRIGLELIQERRGAVTNEMREKKTMLLDGNKTILGRDILSVLSTSWIHRAFRLLLNRSIF